MFEKKSVADAHVNVDYLIMTTIKLPNQKCLELIEKKNRLNAQRHAHYNMYICIQKKRIRRQL